MCYEKTYNMVYKDEETWYVMQAGGRAFMKI